MVAQAARVETTQNSFFVKWKENAPSGFFRLEADGLNRLRATGAIRAPEVLAWQDAESENPEGHLPFLALEWRAATAPSNAVSQKLGEGLAALHRSASPFDGFGLEIDNFLGSQPQDNRPTVRWSDFYRDCRLLPQIARAKQLGLMPVERERLIMRLLEQMGDNLAGYEPLPSLIHGDLWIGNAIFGEDEPSLVDPAVYYADREMEIAFMQLFSGFPAFVFDAYNEVWPLDSGYEDRRPLHQLYPLLVHLNHFGEKEYAESIQNVCCRYVGP
jgi:fructosamine-3-kinase